MNPFHGFSPLPKRLRTLDILLVAVTPLLMVLLLEGYSRGGWKAVLLWLWQNPLMFLCNYALMLGVCLILSLLSSDRARVALSLAACLLCALLGIANRYKMLYRLEPLLFTDVTQLADAKATLTGLQFDIDTALIVRVCAVWLLATVCGLVFLKRKQQTRPWLPALIGAALIVWLPGQCTFELANGSVRTDMVDHAKSEGSLYAAIAMENHRRALMRVDYEEQDVRAQYRELAREVNSTKAGAGGSSPNIIVVLSESFTDEAYLGQYLDLAEPLMPFYQELVKECRTGRLYVPKLGGGTSETEFEVLTGLRSKYAINPYSMGLPPMNSMASVLRQKGYETTAIHWYSGVYYNRYKNLKKLGFDAFYTTDTTTNAFEKTGMFTSDAEHYRSILSQLRHSKNRDFIFCLTMQNHGGYGYDDFRKTYGAAVPFRNGLSDGSERVLANYCYLLGQSDAALRNFIAGLRAFEEPTLLVFFGDHIPPFGTDAFEELGIPLTGDEGHLTPYFIWSNTETLSGSEDMYAYQLGAHALSLAGINDDPFLYYVEKLRKAGLDEDERYDLLSYDALFGKQYAYAEGGLAPENGGFEIGGPMVLEGFDAAVIADAVYLRPKLATKNQSFRLCVDGMMRDTHYVEITEKPFTLQCVMTNSNGTRYNDSRCITYEGTDDLLVRCGKLDYVALPLWTCGYELIRNKWYQDYYVFKSLKPIRAGRNTAATLNGERLQWQPSYGIGRAGQYAVDADGTVYLSVAKKAIADGTGESMQAYLKSKNALFYIFKE